ncbi:OmpA/MotB family protein [Paenirhodobacter enshiensis]|uniref:OmpA/MotB family protein n=1 Tax=Paenirhodobacter enshiensis TaxID=1105367 RepID=UPI0035B3F65E
MRFATRRRRQEEEAESAFVSMTDMTVSFLFIVMILLAFFASQYNDQDVVPRPVHDDVVRQRDAAKREVDRLMRAIAELQARIDDLGKTLSARDARIAELERQLAAALEKLKQRDPIEAYGARSAEARHQMIERLAAAVKEDIAREKIEGLDVSAQGDALRFQGSGLFASGQGGLSGNSLRIIRLLGEHLDGQLPCFTVGPRGDIKASCNPDLVLIETVQIEGHTDADSSQSSNLTLSMVRAMSAFGAIAPDVARDDAPPMLAFQNLLGQPVLAVAGYGEMRPIAGNDTPEGKAANRRIDLRFIMYVPPGRDLIPQTVQDIGRIRTELQRRRDQP